MPPSRAGFRPLAVAALLATLLTACTAGPGTPATGGTSGSRVTGNVTGDRITPGKVVLASPDDVSFTNVGTLSSSGALDLTLSAAPEADSFFTLLPDGSEGCTYTGSGDRSARVSYWNELLVLSAQGDVLGSVEQLSGNPAGPARTVTRLYSGAARSFQGTVSCGDGLRLTLDLNLSAGWNAVEAAGSSSAFELRSLPASTTTTLQGHAEPAAVGVLLDTTQLDFTTSTLHVPATIFQNGGYSGTIRLATDAPELTVTPDTLTLPALSAQSHAPRALGALGLGAQRVDTTLTFTLSGNRTGPAALIVTDDAGRELDRVNVFVSSTLPSLSLAVHTSAPTVLPGSSAPLDFTVYATNGFSGTVSVSALNPPAGITVTPGSATVAPAAYSATGRVTLSVAPTVTPGSYPVTLVGTSGSTTGRTTVTVTVPAPTVTLDANSVTVYGGETVTVPVTVTSQNNFEGSVTLALSGLPAGVTASSRAVTLPRNGAVSTTLTVTGGANVTAGATEVTLTGTGRGLSASRPLTLDTRPTRTRLGRYRVIGTGPVPGGGFWFVRLVEGSGVSPVLTRFDGTAATDAATLNNNNGYIYTTVLPLAGGGAWVPGVGGGPLFKYAGGTVRYWDAGFGWDSPPAVDAQGRLWAVVFRNDMHTLARFDESTSTFTSVVDLSWSSFSKLLGSNRDGTVMAAYNSDSNEVVLVNTATLAVTRLSAPGFSSIIRIAVDATGTAWLYGARTTSGPAIGRVGADGTVTLTTPPATLGYGLQVFAFDAGGTLWMAGDGSVASLTPSTGAVRSVAVSQDGYPSYVVNDAGGVWQVWTDSSGTAYTSLYR